MVDDNDHDKRHYFQRQRQHQHQHQHRDIRERQSGQRTNTRAAYKPSMVSPTIPTHLPKAKAKAKGAQPSDHWKKVVASVLIFYCFLSIIDQSTVVSNILGKITSYFDGEQAIMMTSQLREDISKRTFVVTTTFYPDITDIRFHIALELCKLAKLHKIHLVIVDDSPEHDAVRDQFQQAGSLDYVKVYPQDKDQFAGKGGALRQAIREATHLIRSKVRVKGNALEHAAICFIEPEKVDMMNHMHSIARPILDGVTDVVVPTRSDELFKRTYPIEQYHSESFGNLHFDLLAKEFTGFQREGAQKLDWLFGPFAFKASLARGWLDYQGTSWDAQIIPYVRGVRYNDWRIMSVVVNFLHPKEMKEQEEGYPAWTKKRLKQLTLLFDLLGDKELSP